MYVGDNPTYCYWNKIFGGENMKTEIFNIESEDHFDVFLLDENNKILDSATLNKPN